MGFACKLTLKFMSHWALLTLAAAATLKRSNTVIFELGEEKGKKNGDIARRKSFVQLLFA